MFLKSSTRVVGPSWRCAHKPLRIYRHIQLHFRSVSTIPEIKPLDIDITAFKRDFFDAQKPLVLRGSAASFPAIQRWFKDCPEKKTTVLGDAFNPDTVFPYELVTTSEGLHQFKEIITNFQEIHTDVALLPLVDSLKRQVDEEIKSAPEREQEFLRFQFPLALLKHVLLNLPPEYTVPNLYIAQADLSEVLNAELLRDIPLPDLVRESGKGDVYNSSLWMGLEPTFTPWHRDPNHNFFCQLCSSKAVRILPPNRGKSLFMNTMAKVEPTTSFSTRIRGEEMMQGAQRKALLDAVWGDEAPDTIRETVLRPSDALFLPKGWWHSLKSGENHGHLNASVNWWFR